MFQDKTIVCKDCGQEFTFTANEQEFFAEKGFTNEPQRCKPCRDARKGMRFLRPFLQSSVPAPYRPSGLLQRLLP